MSNKQKESYRLPLGWLMITSLLFLSPAAAHADAGIAMLPFAYPVILVFLLPVIAIEATYIRFRLHTAWGNTIAATTKANLVTMLLGFPLAWLVFFVMEMVLYLILAFSGLENHVHWTLSTRATDFLIVITSAAWMGPVDGKWAIPVAFVALLIPSFFLSGFLESRLLEKRGWLKHDGQCKQVVWQANVLSYVFLAAAGVIALTEVVEHL